MRHDVHCFVVTTKEVSIHAPTRGATGTRAFNSFALSFQSTHPHGVRQLCKCCASRIIPFQSTHPHGVRRNSLYRFGGAFLVSIHAPTRGATCLSPCSVFLDKVSIHAPTRGATSFLTSDMTTTACFNPRTHTGCDVQVYRKADKSGLFQSTHPHGVRRSG